MAVYTTIYPGAEPYLAEWACSLRAQTDKDFALWIGLDTLEISSVEAFIGAGLEVNWMTNVIGSTPAQIRQSALAKISETHSEVILVDSDDVLHPSRVAAARRALVESDLAGCALRLVNQRGEDLGMAFDLPHGGAVTDVFPRNNVFGFSNSAYRCEVLKHCLPIASSAVLVDWFLATNAWLLGAEMTFDRVARMDYRQHSNNTARVRYPINSDQVVTDTKLVREHFDLFVVQSPTGFIADRFDELQRVAEDVEKFQAQVVCEPARLDMYVEALNALAPAPLWWTCVANPALKHLWNSGAI